MRFSILFNIFKSATILNSNGFQWFSKCLNMVKMEIIKVVRSLLFVSLRNPVVVLINTFHENPYEKRVLGGSIILIKAF